MKHLVLLTVTQEVFRQRHHHAVLQTNGKLFAKDITLSCTREALFHQTNGKHIAKNIICHLTDNSRHHMTFYKQMRICTMPVEKWEALCQEHCMPSDRQLRNTLPKTPYGILQTNGNWHYASGEMESTLPRTPLCHLTDN